MSIQQSVNQAISGSLFLLNQTDTFQRLKAIRDAKREVKTRREIREKVDNAIVDGKDDAVGNAQKEIGEQDTAAQADKVDPNAYIKLFTEINDEYSRKEANMLMDMQSKLRGSIAEAEQAKKSEEFRKMILQGVYVKGGDTLG